MQRRSEPEKAPSPMTFPMSQEDFEKRREVFLRRAGSRKWDSLTTPFLTTLEQIFKAPQVVGDPMAEGFLYDLAAMEDFYDITFQLGLLERYLEQKAEKASKEPKKAKTPSASSDKSFTPMEKSNGGGRVFLRL